jgi:hypothetical protein
MRGVTFFIAEPTDGDATMAPHTQLPLSPGVACGPFPWTVYNRTYIERVIESWHRSCPHGLAGDLRGPAAEIPTPPSDHIPLGGVVLLVLDSGLLRFNARMTPDAREHGRTARLLMLSA